MILILQHYHYQFESVHNCWLASCLARWEQLLSCMMPIVYANVSKSLAYSRKNLTGLNRSDIMCEHACPGQREQA